MFRAVRDSAEWPALQQRMDESRAQSWFPTVSQIDSPPDLREWKTLLFDPESTLIRLSIPVLAIYGEHDATVPPAKNAQRMEELLRRGGASLQIAVVKNANHALETFGRLEGGEWKWPDAFWIWPRKAPELLDLVPVWLARTRR